MMPIAMMGGALLLTLMVHRSTGLTCPSSCGFIAPVPYPFGAAPGCGSPGFLISNCSMAPQWDIQVAGVSHLFYIRSIGPAPSAPNPNTNLSYGYGGSIVMSLSPGPRSQMYICENVPIIFNMTSLSSLNLYAFEFANLTLYQDRYLLLNCTSSYPSPPSGTLIPSSPACNKLRDHCNFGSSTPCLDYTPVKELSLGSLVDAYNCSSFRRVIVASDDDPISSWVVGVQFAWGPVNYVDKCSACQSTGGTCGYDTGDQSFICFCGSEDSSTDCESGRSKLKGIVVGVSCAVAILMILASSAFCYHRHKYYFWSLFYHHEQLKLDGINQAPIEIPYGALVAATKSFNTKIGQGAFGKVYRGTLLDGNEVAVKVLDASVSHSDEQFINELATIGNIHHLNVARLFGFCFRRSKRILVYEYVVNGSLDKYLFSSNKASGMVRLNWRQRYDIAVGIARGLSYMHEECRNCIIHCDIKPQNILLDAGFRPKISDFGLARLLTREESRVLTHARGTPGYVAPEFWSLGSGPLTAKFDVYSYGMVLLEIVQGRRMCHQLELSFLEETMEGTIRGMNVYVDEVISHEADLDQARVCTLVALWCIQEDPSLRPTMSKVVQFLQGMAPVPSNPPRPFKKLFGNDEISHSFENSTESFLKISK